MPKAGVFAERQGEVVAAQIAAEMQGKKDATAFDGKGFCFIETAADRAVRGEGETRAWELCVERSSGMETPPPFAATVSAFAATDRP